MTPFSASSFQLLASSEKLAARSCSSDSLLCHHHRSDDRHQQQQRGDLEGEHILSVQHRGHFLRVVVLYDGQHVLRENTCPFRVHSDKQSTQCCCGNDPYDPLTIELALAD